MSGSADRCARCDHQRQEHRPGCGVTTFSSADLREPHDCPCDGFLDLPALRARLAAAEQERDQALIDLGLAESRIDRLLGELQANGGNDAWHPGHPDEGILG